MSILRAMRFQRISKYRRISESGISIWKLIPDHISEGSHMLICGTNETSSSTANMIR